MNLAVAALRYGIAAHLDDALAHDSGFDDPFRVFCFKPFHDVLFKEIMRRLPGDELFVDLKHYDAIRSDGTSTRTVLAREKTPQFWLYLFGALCSKEVESVFRKHVGFAGEVKATARLLRDAKGYRIAPHTDSAKKVCTVQFYLPADDTQAEMGTSFYRRVPMAHGFIHAHTLPFLPNTGYCFAVSDHSWHGVERIVQTKPRNSLIINYYLA
jgi:hypothetical protein